MPTFGAYETVTEVFPGAVCSVWSARLVADGAGGARFAIKVCHPDADILGEEQSQRALDLFLERIDAQRRLAGLAETCWAPVHEAGASDGQRGAYYVTDFCPRGSLEKLLTGRMRFDSRTLSMIVRSVLTGIKQTRDFLRRPHGALRAANVLVVGDGDVTTARFMLSDPAPASLLQGRTDVAGDLKALGELLYRLVTHQEYHERVGWPIADSPHWKKQADGERWRGMCNRLLDPNPASPPTVEEIEQTLLNLAATGGKGKGKLIAIGAAALVVVAGGVVGVMMMKKGPTPNGGGTVGPVEVPPESWQELVREYDSWFSEFSRSAGRMDDEKAAALAARVPEAKAWLAAVRGQTRLDDPWQIAGVPRSRQLSELEKEPPEAIRTKDGARATSDLLTVVQGIKSTLSSGEWSLARESRKLAETWRGLGWTVQAEQIESASSEVKPDGSLLSALASLDVALKDAQGAEKARTEAEPLIAKIDSEAKAIGNDAVLGTFRAWATAYPASTGVPITELAGRIAKVRETATTVVRLLDSPERRNICFDELAKSQFYASFGDPTPEKYVDWTNAAKDRRFANPSPSEDPRAGKDLAARAAKIGEELGKLTKNDLKPTPRSLEALDALASGLGASVSGGAGVSQKVQAVRAKVEALAGLAWDCRTRREIEGVNLTAAVTQLDEVAREWRIQNADKEKDITEELARLGSLTSPVRDSEAVRRWWGARRAEVFQEPDESRRYDRARAIESRLEALDQALPRWSAPAGSGGWVLALERRAAEHRDAAIGQFLTAKTDASWTDAEQDALAASLGGWNEQLGGIVTAYQGVQGLLDQGYGLDDAPAGAQTAAQLVANATGPVFEAVKDALDPLPRRITDLQQAAAATNAARLAALLDQDPTNQPELTLAAWRRLGTIGDGSWPASIGDLDREAGDFRDKLRAVLIKETLAPRRDALGAEIAAERARRWERFVARASSQADIERALDPTAVLGPLEIDASKATDPLVRHRVGVMDLKRALAAPGLADAQAAALVTAFVAATPPPVKANAKVATLLEGLTKLAAGEETGPPPVDPRLLGPGSLANAGWAGVVSQDAQGRTRLTFTKQNTRMEFVRVEPAPGVSDPFFIGADEFSVQQFIDVVEGAGRAGWSQVQEMMPKVEDAREGPQAWRPVTSRGEFSRLGIANEWLQTNRLSVGTGAGNVPAYAPAYLRPGADGKTIIQSMAPSGASPMQFVSPSAAVYAAALVGCRLPTPAEWQAAAQAYGPGAAAPNLRDQAWKVQLDYVGETRPKMRVNQEELLYPDAGAYLPRSAAFGAAAVVRANAGNDGWLWFAPTGEGGGSGAANLIGNVAEFVIANPGAGLAGAPDARSAQAFVAAHANDLAIIGASALSPPEIDANVPTPVPEFDAVGGWADVGFRLAFPATGTAPAKRPLSEQAASLLASQGADPYAIGP